MRIPRLATHAPMGWGDACNAPTRGRCGAEIGYRPRARKKGSNDLAYRINAGESIDPRLSKVVIEDLSVVSARLDGSLLV
jgi:hypothetical protein